MTAPSAMIVIAHSSQARGASEQKHGLDEWVISRRASVAAFEYLSGDFECSLYDVGPVKDDGAYLARKVLKADAQAPMIAVEIHCNAGPATADYREAIHWPNSAVGAAAARAIADGLNARWPMLKPAVARPNDKSKDRHWFYFLRKAVPATVIVEGFFITNPGHLARLAEADGPEEYGRAVARGLRIFLEAERLAQS